MKKNTIRTALLLALLSMTGYNVNAQNKELKVGTNPTIKEPSAVLEVESANKGILLPRVALTSTTDVATITFPANALTVFNTATTATGTNDVAPGYYYWSASNNKWIRIVDKDADLRFVGSNNHLTQDAGVADNGSSLGFGMDNIAIGRGTMHSIIGGNNNIAVGAGSLFDLQNGEQNIVLGNNSGGYIMNESNNIIIGNNSASLYGFDNLGNFILLSNSLRISDFLYGYTDPITSRKRISIGDYFYNSNTDNIFKESFNVTEGGVWIKDIGTPAYAGNIATDKVVVADADGVLKTVAVADIATETNTTLSIAGGELVYANEDGNNANVNLISADADNTLVAGTDGRLFGSNLYTTNGSLTNDRTVDLNGNSLTIQGSDGYTEINDRGGYVDIIGQNNDRAHLRLATDDFDGDGQMSMFDVDVFSDNYLQMNATGDMGGILFGTHLTIDPAPIQFATSPGGLTTGITRMHISGDGDIGIDETSPTERLDIGTGNVRVRDINTNAGMAGDKMVVADANGVLKTVDAPTTTAIRTETADYVAVATDETILVDASGGAVTIDLPSTPSVGKRYNVKKIDNTANTVSVSGNGGNIDGNATVSGTLPYQGWVMQFDGANWFIISRI